MNGRSGLGCGFSEQSVNLAIITETMRGKRVKRHQPHTSPSNHRSQCQAAKKEQVKGSTPRPRPGRIHQRATPSSQLTDLLRATNVFPASQTVRLGLASRRLRLPTRRPWENVAQTLGIPQCPAEQVDWSHAAQIKSCCGVKLVLNWKNAARGLELDLNLNLPAQRVSEFFLFSLPFEIRYEVAFFKLIRCDF